MSGDEQGRLWAEHVRTVNARGECEFSGYTIRHCVATVCDCGMEWWTEPEIDEFIARASKELNREP